jgi:hypothetical protein
MMAYPFGADAFGTSVGGRAKPDSGFRHSASPGFDFRDGYGGRSGSRRPRGRRSKLQFEPLEPRLLLAADFGVDLDFLSVTDATLRAVDEAGTPVFELVDATDTRVTNAFDDGIGGTFDTVGLIGDFEIAVTGGAADETFIIDAASFEPFLTAGDMLPTITFDGLGGDDELGITSSAQIASDWTITGETGGTAAGTVSTTISDDTGGLVSTLDVTTFTDVEALTGGDGDDDLIGPAGTNVWEITGDAQGNIDGVDFSEFDTLTGGTTDTLKNSTTGTDVTITSDGAGVFSGLSFAGFEAYEGAGSDTILGSENDTTWLVDALGDVTASGIAFTGVTNLVGDIGVDTLENGTGSAQMLTISGPGAGTFTSLTFSGFDAYGGTGSDTIQGSDDSTAWLLDGADSGAVSGITFSGVSDLHRLRVGCQPERSHHGGRRRRVRYHSDRRGHRQRHHRQHRHPRGHEHADRHRNRLVRHHHDQLHRDRDQRSADPGRHESQRRHGDRHAGYRQLDP